MHRRIAVALGASGVMVAAATAALATSAAFSASEDSPAAVPVRGIPTVPEYRTSTIDGTGRPSSTTRDRQRSHTYAAANAGVVELRVSGSSLQIVDVRPNAGWTVTETEHEERGGVDQIEVHFTSATRAVEFVALLVDDEIVTRIDDEDRHDDVAKSVSASTSTTVEDNGGGSGIDDPNSRPGNDDDAGEPEDPEEPEEPEGPEDPEDPEDEPDEDQPDGPEQEHDGPEDPEHDG